MFRSSSFVAQAERLERRHRDDPVALRAGLEEIFRAGLRGIPPTMVAELFAYLFEQYEQGTADRQRLGDVLDLMAMDYDDAADPLAVEDWSVLADLVNEFAGELDMSLVQYIMERVLEHKAL